MELRKRKPPLLLQLVGEPAKKAGPSAVPPGRHIYIAQMPTTMEEIKELRQRFNEIMKELSYREARAWCRGMNRTWSTFLARKYGHRAPTLEEIIVTCAWVDAGKPVEKKASHSIASFAGLVAKFNSGRRYIAQEIPVPELSTNPDIEVPL
ncbi:MAG: hypothetical protein MUO97_02725 [Dehalococcoidia bacterium]|nr:hypothetical protein [Dehalococcoidia bacterium]